MALGDRVFVDWDLSDENRVPAAWFNALNGLRFGADDPLLGSALMQFRGSGTSIVTRSVQDRLRDFRSIKDYGAVGDGEDRPLSEGYSTLAAAQAVYPHATALTQQLDWAAIQGAIDACEAAGGGEGMAAGGALPDRRGYGAGRWH